MKLKQYILDQTKGNGERQRRSKMYEELIRRLRNAAGGPEGIKMAHDAVDAISALQTENAELREEIGCMRHNVSAMQATLEQQAKNCATMLAEKDKEIDRLNAKAKQWKQTSEENFASCEKLQIALSRVEAERATAISDAAHVCTTCGRFEDGACPILAYKDYPKDCEQWKWRGAQGVE